MSEIQRRLAVARGDAAADLILANARVINVFNGSITSASVAIVGDTIAGVGDYRQGRAIIDLAGRHLAPGLINGHTHLESSMLTVSQYARAVVPHGTTAVVSDLHEMANVAGIDGIRLMLDEARDLPLDLWLMAPSCVPATPMETSGAEIDAAVITRMLKWPECIGLGEVMNYPGVIHGDKNVLGKLKRARGRAIDGHAPGLRGADLAAYASAGIGSDHECVTRAEAEEKLAVGLHIMIREGSSEKNLEALLPLVNDSTYQRCLFVVDDRSCFDLQRDGDIDAVIRKAIRLGLSPVRAVQLATVNSAVYFRLPYRGAVAPGYKADLVVIDDLVRFQVNEVYHHGKLVSAGGESLFPMRREARELLADTFHVRPFTVAQFRFAARGETIPVIEMVPGQIITRKLMLPAPRDGRGNVIADTAQDILKLAVLERHRESGRVGLGLVRGLGLKRGAIASSIAHDSHNIVVAGASDEDMFSAVQEVIRLRGGLVVVADGKVVASLALPVAGLLSPEPLERVTAQFEQIEVAVRRLGSQVAAPMAALSFLALPVIPELRLTDRGLLDVATFTFLD